MRMEVSFFTVFSLCMSHLNIIINHIIYILVCTYIIVNSRYRSAIY